MWLVFPSYGLNSLGRHRHWRLMRLQNISLKQDDAGKREVCK